MANQGIIVADNSVDTGRRRDFDNPVAGDLPQYDGSSLVRIAVGAAGQVLRLVGAVATWKTFLEKRAGTVLNASFTGSPSTATVTFATAFADANYAVSLVSVTTVGGKKFSPNIESKTAADFVINMNTDKITDLVSVDFMATKNGET